MKIRKTNINVSPRKEQGFYVKGGRSPFNKKEGAIWKLEHQGTPFRIPLPKSAFIFPSSQKWPEFISTHDEFYERTLHKMEELSIVVRNSPEKDEMKIELHNYIQ